MSSLNCGLQLHGGEIVKRRVRYWVLFWCVCDSVVWDWGELEFGFLYIYIFLFIYSILFM